jgi:hypothetical protein
MDNMRPPGEVEYSDSDEDFTPEDGVLAFIEFVYFNIEMKCCLILNLASSFAERGPQTARAKRAEDKKPKDKKPPPPPPSKDTIEYVRNILKRPTTK